MDNWFDAVKPELTSKYGLEVGAKLANLIIEIDRNGTLESDQAFRINQLIGNLLDKDYKRDYP